MSKPEPAFFCGTKQMGLSGESNPQRVNPIKPSELDPRPPIPCNPSPCCTCSPPFPTSERKCYGLKLRQLDDCYACRVSEGSKRRREQFYQGWQLHLDKLKPIPGYDYIKCSKYIDLGENKDFQKYSRYKPNAIGDREKARINFLRPKKLGEALAEREAMRNECPPVNDCPIMCNGYAEEHSHDLRESMDSQYKLYNEDPITIWQEKRLKPLGFVDGSTLMKTRMHPFKRDASFTTPIDQFSEANDSPCKEFRQLKITY